MRPAVVNREPLPQSVADAIAASALCGDAGLAAVLLAPQRCLLAA